MALNFDSDIAQDPVYSVGDGSVDEILNALADQIEDANLSPAEVAVFEEAVSLAAHCVEVFWGAKDMMIEASNRFGSLTYRVTLTQGNAQFEVIPLSIIENGVTPEWISWLAERGLLQAEGMEGLHAVPESV